MITQSNKTMWTMGNLLMLIGGYLLLYVGGLYADEQYNLWAADGSSSIPLPSAAFVAPTPSPVAAQPTVTRAAPSVAPAAPLPVPNARADVAPHERLHIQLNNPSDSRELSSSVPQAAHHWGDSTITRISIPDIQLDRKVQQVGWHLEEQNGVQVAVWDVPKYAVGHNQDTANPGEPGNIVLTGHSGGSAYPFNYLYEVLVGSKVLIWTNDQQFSYTVSDRVIVDEQGPTVTDAQRRENARYIEETPNEQITMVTCWPLNGPLKFTQRMILHAMPDHAASTPLPQGSPQTP
ncbi:MAG: sortase [Herpetosiphonaceae bacterium]|nr:sortase [Herpetosiphonaceae bacterium]